MSDSGGDKEPDGKAVTGDMKYFMSSNANEIAELKAELNQNKQDKVRDALKKIIARYMQGKDMSTLFTDVVKNMATTSLELKKLIYLYIINNAREKADDAILVVNSFQRDAQNQSPIIRALAIRTMGCINVKTISEYLCECIGNALKDQDPYVRKTAAVGVSKLFAVNPELVEDCAYIEELRNLISDTNAMVVSNAVASLAEMSERTGRDFFQMNSGVLSKLLNAMTQCTEWGMVYILDCLAKYEPDPQEAQDVVERVSANLNHSNAAVLLSTVRVVVRYLDRLQNPLLQQKLLNEKLPPPLVSLVMNHRPEVQYVALTNINLIIQKAIQLQKKVDAEEKAPPQPGKTPIVPGLRPGLILSEQVQTFFCRYNDPTYLKMEKLEIMVKLVNMRNIDKVLMEFKTYCTEVDVEFVRKSVLAIGRCAIKLDGAAERCIVVLMDLIKASSSGAEAAKYIIQETVVVIQDIFRKYPERFEPIISVLCEYLDTLEEPEAKSAMIWIIGEYSGRIDNAPQLLEDFRKNFLDEPAQVQLQLLTAIVKLFLRRPDETREMISQVFEQATNQEDNPDVRDRGYMYWRLCFMNIDVATNVILTEKPVISDDDFNHSPEVLETLLANLTTLASVYHKPPENFIIDGKQTILFKKTQASSKKNNSDSDSDDDVAAPPPVDDEHKQSSGPASGLAADHDILDMFAEPRPQPRAPAVEVKPCYEDNGLSIRVKYVREEEQPFMVFSVRNLNDQPLTQFQVAFDNNVVGIQPASQITCHVAAGGVGVLKLPIAIKQLPEKKHGGALLVALRTNFCPMAKFREDTVRAYVLFEAKSPGQSAHVEKDAFLATWGGLEGNEITATVASPTDIEEVKRRIGSANVYQIAHRVLAAPDGQRHVMYYSLCLRNIPILAELSLPEGVVSVRSSNKPLAEIVLQGLTELVRGL